MNSVQNSVRKSIEYNLVEIHSRTLNPVEFH